MNPVRKLVAKLGGIVVSAEHFGVSKSLIGKACITGKVHALNVALAMANEARPGDSLGQLAWCESVSPAAPKTDK